MKKLFNLSPIVGVILIGVLSRFIPHPPNFTPVGGLAIFSGALLPGPLGLVLPLIIMFLSDVVLGLHASIPFVYGSFLIITLLGRTMKNRWGFVQLTGLSITSSIIFFLVTNFGSWLTWDFYPKTLSGLMNSYLMAVPFFKNTLIGDLVYSYFFFYGYLVFSRILKKVYIIAGRSN